MDCPAEGEGEGIIMRGTTSMRNAKMFQVVAMLVLLGLLMMPVTMSANNLSNATIINSTFAEVGIMNLTSDSRGGAHSQIDLKIMSQTLHWQAYYGEITSRFVLSDGTDTFFNWDNPIPSGEVFASRDANIDWSQIACADYDTVQTEQAITGNSTDRVNLTFDTTNSRLFSVADTSIALGQCEYSTFTIDSTGEKGTFEEVLLESQNSMVYTAIVEADATAFTGETVDFQMLVAEDGLDDITTTYYFYAELE